MFYQVLCERHKSFMESVLDFLKNTVFRKNLKNFEPCSNSCYTPCFIIRNIDKAAVLMAERSKTMNITINQTQKIIAALELLSKKKLTESHRL